MSATRKRKNWRFDEAAYDEWKSESGEPFPSQLDPIRHGRVEEEHVGALSEDPLSHVGRTPGRTDYLHAGSGVERFVKALPKQRTVQRDEHADHV